MPNCLWNQPALIGTTLYPWIRENCTFLPEALAYLPVPVRHMNCTVPCTPKPISYNNHKKGGLENKVFFSISRDKTVYFSVLYSKLYPAAIRF